MGGPDKVVNSIVVKGRDQVMLKVSVAEVQRNIIKQLGIDLSANMNYGTAVVNFNNANPFTANSGPLSSNAPDHLGLEQGRRSHRYGNLARHGKRRRHPHACRTQSDRHFR